MAAVTIKGLSKSYTADTGVPAVTELDLPIGDNQFVTLLGPSGCGKTTTLRMIAGYMAPDAGSIHVGDRLVSAPGHVVPPEDRGMGMVFQNYAVWPHKTVYENVVFGLRVRKVAAAKARSQVEIALGLVNLTGYEDRLPSELSGGQQQRVALARSLVVEPAILLLDEPLSNLDAKLRERMRTELKELQRRTAITFIYVTHDQAEALALSDQIAVMHAGRLQQFGSPTEIYRRPANRLVADFMGHVNFMPAEVVAGADGRAEVLIAGSLRTTARNPDKIATGETVDVAVRPEDIGVEPATSPRPDRLHAEIVERVFLGNLIEYQAKLMDGTLLRVQTHPKQNFAGGDRVALSIDPENLTAFPRPR